MRLAALALAALLSTPAWAELPVVANPDHEAMLASADPQLAANKRLVYDFWREVFEARQLERAPQYLHPDYRQHNPMVPTGLAGFQKAFAGATPKPVQTRVQSPLVAVVAEGDLVVLSFVATRQDAEGKPYTTTWFDQFRVRDGKITEHWDPALKR
ncbi:nuclear transport factor 2 family protein [Inhella proteolytica]|uniref:Nuclear transport factor 2 family protein n=1 Tax=Inhella proteolytica TaxID=2795029 RepID=A0A931JA61_9BURK|nr:nuclear transport factor 2 family protein [Inhella proteolytica]MBH9579217.1 nuclear transport factor 2 family protein [Inhella proteolytica]